MASGSSFYLVSYDIPDDKRRTKIAKILLDFGSRVQYSVFEANLKRKQLQDMRARLRKAVVEDEDSVRIYALCTQCVGSVEILGQGTVTQDQEVYVL